MTRCDLSQALLHGVEMDFSCLNNADMCGTILRDSNVRASTFLYANMYCTYAADTDFTNSIFEGANLKGSTLCRAKLVGADFSRANLRDANLRGADLTNADFTNADLSGADLTGSNYCDANLTGADLTGTIFTDNEINSVQPATRRNRPATRRNRPTRNAEGEDFDFV
jgi:uncharacterized protein YjbI with pentapeptide repeats